MVRNTKNYAKKRITAPKLSPLASAIKLSLLGLGLGLSNGAAHADTINVTTRFDNLNDSHECTLRDAITSFYTGVVSSGCQQIDATGTNTIYFDDSLANQTILLTNGELSIASSDPLTIPGNNITVDAQEESRVFTVQNNASLWSKHHWR